jgi:nucleoside-diphosphate-sugar epimerase
MNIFLTGYTGNIGHAIACELQGHSVHALVRDAGQGPELPHVKLVTGDLEKLPASLAEQIDVIIHSAADTAFGGALYDLRRTNVEGTARVLEFARTCPKLKKVVHLSTTCVCGIQSGEIPEERLPKPDAFVNAYEQSKWEAEELVFDSGLPAEIVRLSIVAGSEEDGSVRRSGGLHHALFWLWKGLIPMMPGTPETPLDLISTEYAARVVTACALSAVEPGRVLHACAGAASPLLGELLEHVGLVFAARSSAWRQGSITPPMIVDAHTFALFEQTVEQSGDALFRRVCRDSKSFLPGLLHSRRYCNAKGRALARDSHGDWRRLTELVTSHVIDSRS